MAKPPSLLLETSYIQGPADLKIVPGLVTVQQLFEWSMNKTPQGFPGHKADWIASMPQCHKAFVLKLSCFS